MLFYKVCLAYLNRNYNQCISLLESYKPGRDAFLKPAVEQMVLSDIVLLYNKTHQPEKALQLIERLDKEAASSHNTVKKYSAYGLIADYWKQRGDSMKAEHYDYLKLKTKEKLNEDNNLNKMKENRFLNEISQINSSLKAETAKKRLVTLFLILAGIALTVIAVLLILQVRAARAQKRYVDLLYRRNQQLLANNQLLVAVDHPEPEEPSRQKPVELPAGIVEAIERVMARRRSSAATPSPCRRSASSRASTATTFRRPSATNTTPTSRGCSTATASRRPAVAWPPPIRQHHHRSHRRAAGLLLAHVFLGGVQEGGGHVGRGIHPPHQAKVSYCQLKYTEFIPTSVCIRCGYDRTFLLGC